MLFMRCEPRGDMKGDQNDRAQEEGCATLNFERRDLVLSLA